MKKLKQRLQSLGWKGDNGCVLSGDTSYIGILDWDNGKCAFQAKELDKELLAVFYAKMRCGRWIKPSVLYNHFVHLGYCPTDCKHQCDILEEVVVTPMNNLDEDEIYVSKLFEGVSDAEIAMLIRNHFATYGYKESEIKEVLWEVGLGDMGAFAEDYSTESSDD